MWYDSTGVALWVQYKTDCAAHRTERVFLEAALRDSRADLFVYLLPGRRKLLVFTADAILSNLDEWADRYGLRMVENRGYASPGVPVPLNNLLPLAWVVLPVDEADLPCHECTWAMPRDAA